MKRKRTIPLILCILPSLFFSGCSTQNLYEPEDVPEDTDLVYWIAEPWKDAKKDKVKLLSPGMGMSRYTDINYEGTLEKDEFPDVLYVFTGYPDVTNYYHATSIRVTNPNLKVLGLTSFSTKEDIQAKRKDCKYKRAKEEDSCLTYQIAKDVTISFVYGKYISLFAKTTNKDNVLF